MHMPILRLFVVVKQAKAFLGFALQRLQFLRFASLPQRLDRHLSDKCTRRRVEFEQRLMFLLLLRLRALLVAFVQILEEGLGWIVKDIL